MCAWNRKAFQNRICQHFFCRDFVGFTIRLEYPAIDIRSSNLATAPTVRFFHFSKNICTVNKNRRGRNKSILYCQLRIFNFDLFIFHIISSQSQCRFEFIHYRIQNIICSDTSITGVQIQIEILDPQMFFVDRCFISAASSRLCFIRTAAASSFLVVPILYSSIYSSISSDDTWKRLP